MANDDAGDLTAAARTQRHAQSARRRLDESREGVTTAGRSHARHAGVLIQPWPRTFFFRAVASDGKVRTGMLHGETEKLRRAANCASRDSRRSTSASKRRSRSRLKLPAFGGGKPPRRAVLHAGALHAAQRRRAARPRAVHHQRTHRTRQRSAPSCWTSSASSRAANRWPTASATQPEYFSELYINMVRAGEASGSLAAIFERLAEFERTRDDLRNYIISSMVYPALLAIVGTASVIFLADIRRPALCARSFRIRT